jgi:alkanesulfonate monooxygenase SsuD/methylene tetrahydromethanopterin reductase-like flavin-dependent oxidoreductase (luciferase family)
MDIGLFMVPFRLPQTDLQDGYKWDMQVVEWAEEFGLSEVWFGEHSTVRWEPCCSPELYIAAAARQTERIRLATGANVIANHNPVALAHRLMQLDMMTNGRLMVAFGAGSYPYDLQIHGSNDEPRERMAEAAKIIQMVWAADGPIRYEGKYWTLDIPAYDNLLMGPYMKPFQQPHPPIAVAGVSPASSTLKQAGATGAIPMSFNVSRELLAGHWYRYVEGAEEAGLTPDRNTWRVAHNVLVADTDEEAMDLALNGGMAQTYREWMLPAYAGSNMLAPMVPELDNITKPEDVSIEYLAREKWLVGSPDTIVEKLQRDIEISGGFGHIIAFTFDYLEKPEAYRRNLELLGTEVLPRIKDIVHPNQALSELTPPPELAVTR